MACKMRLWNPEWKSDAIADKDVIKPDVHGKNPTYIEITYSGASSATATEVGAAADNALDATAIPVLMFNVSSSANDTNTAAGHVRKIRIIGISVASSANFQGGTEDPVFSLEEINMNGTTNVMSTRYYLRVMHIYASDWGSGDDDAAGNITCEYPENTAIVTIAANANESNASIIYGCAGNRGRLSWLNTCAADAAFNNT